MAEFPHSRSFQTPSEYYSSFTSHPHLQHAFQDIDEELNFKAYLQSLRDVSTQNFVLDFGNEDAWCAVNLRQEDFAVLLHKPKPRCFGTRWINIWAPEEQKDSLKTITSHYGISERLQAMMCTDPVKHQPKQEVTHTPMSGFRERSVDRPLPPVQDPNDPEAAYELKDLQDPDEVKKPASFRGLTFAQVTDQIWHFCSVDHGPRYTCIGYNSLYVVPNIDCHNGKDLPDGRRIWSWLILCDDGTIISIQENPYPGLQDLPSEKDVKSVLGVVRRNVQFIFSGVSKQHSAISESDSLVTIRVRHFSDSGPNEATIKQEDGASLLFYYIFDDWVSSYGLIAKREHQYGVFLDQVRSNMLHKPVVDLIDELHWLGRRLGVLKRVYQSYELIMMRILQRQRLLRDEARSNRQPFSIGNTFNEGDFAELRHMTMQSSLSLGSSSNTSVGVPLSSAAAARFERLLDRIKLYCLAEIDTCLTEKESLTFLNFNLIALKDSQAVEKLTRITILLAKVTILFLPVSLMTAYFSTELQNVKGVYTIRQYWISFGVIMFLSIVTLSLFGYASDTIEGTTIYRSLFRVFFRSSKDRITAQRKVANSQGRTQSDEL